MIAAALLTVGVLAGCGADDTADGSSAEPTNEPATDPTEESSPEPVVVDITIENGEVSPVGEEVEASVGQPIELRVDSDSADDLHIHSKPEQEFEVEADPGTEQLFEFTVDVPGQVDVESHETATTIVTLVVQP